MIVLILIAWAPTPAFRQVIPALVLIGLLALGVEALRRQAAREYPDERWSNPFKGIRWPRRRARRQDTTVDQLERLGRLRDQGLLDAPEYEQQKAKVLAGSPTA